MRRCRSFFVLVMASLGPCSLRAEHAEPAAGMAPADFLEKAALKPFVDSVASVVEAIGRRDIEAAVAGINQLGIKAGDRQLIPPDQIEQTFGWVIKNPAFEFESADLTSIEKVSSRLYLLTFVAHGRYGPVLFEVITDRYNERWRLVIINWHMDGNVVMTRAPRLDIASPVVTFNFVDQPLANHALGLRGATGQASGD